MIPRDTVDRITDAAHVEDVVGEFVTLKKRGTNLLGLCPFHGEKTPSFTVSRDKQFFHCFGCGAHGSAIGFLMKHRNLEFVEAVEEQDNEARRPHAVADVADALICAKVLHYSGKDLETIRRQSAVNRAFRQLRLDPERSAAIQVEAAGEISALRAVVGA